MQNDNMTKMVNGITTPDEGYKVLGLAVIAQAAYDYRRARLQRDTMKIKTLERFFRGKYFNVFGRGIVSGDYIVDELMKESIDEVYKRLYGRAMETSVSQTWNEEWTRQ